MQSSDTEVLICGAGPTGMVLALWLTKQNIRVRIIDKNSGPGSTSRALAVQARTLELYRQLDLADTALANGYQAPGFNFWSKGSHRGRIGFSKKFSDLTAYPYILILPQDRHERMLAELLEKLGVHIERHTELTGFEQDESGVRANLRDANGNEEVCCAQYLAGCDGAHSIVRKTLGIDFAGGTYSRFFYVADVEAEGPPMNGEVHINLDSSADFLAIFPLAAQGKARLVGTLIDDRPDRMNTLTFDDISENAIDKLKIEVRKVDWFSTYKVHHRVAERFRDGRIFLLGDAGHIHSPAGGQGMNTGIGDAINLAWKLAEVIGKRAEPDLLDSYEIERGSFARRLVSTTDRLFTLATSTKLQAKIMRTRIVPAAFPLAARMPAALRFNFRIISQLSLQYRNGPLSSGKAGRIHGGDRLPWIPNADGENDNFAPAGTIEWQVHVYGEVRPALKEWCDSNDITLRCFVWNDACERAGIARDAAYLIRPDMYVAMADPDGDPEQMGRFLLKAPSDLDSQPYQENIVD
ncbi:FAD-dependent monooxygenase [Saccharibacillus kuerlensis]|uniref:2-polyprenyl-6-methoxyphenol hydroxylase n=1 Tax=Saccharibacillus kuerlensis TaxID=459527 RepID=A0ABQ2L022_9BACL|nr:FAD-dependent monooxygenase [Saccharibacillus kuerlensis]GGN98342.1 2-polyprenyl-6-methoxyphenol hydroxylase [Saccharibacillus kuerlensis]